MQAAHSDLGGGAVGAETGDVKADCALHGDYGPPMLWQCLRSHVAAVVVGYGPRVDSCCVRQLCKFSKSCRTTIVTNTHTR